MMRAQRRGTLLAALCLSALAAPVYAQERAAGRATVAQDGAVSLRASDDDDDLCLELVAESDSEAGSCGSGAGSGVVVESPASGGPRHVGAAVSAAAVTTEVRRAGVLLASAPTVAGESYRGRRAGSVRFALVRLPTTTRTDGLRVRALDGAGQVREVLAGFDPDLVSERRTLLSGRAGRVRWRVSSNRSSRLTPTLADVGHEAVLRCVYASTTVTDTTGSGPTCVGDAPADMLVGLAGPGAAQTQESCRPGFRLVHGVVEGDAVRVTVLRGDGRRVAARTARLPGAAHTTYAYLLPAGMALRSVRLQPRRGRGRTVALALAPVPVSCGLNLSGGGSLGGGWTLYAPAADGGPITPVGPVTTVAGQPVFRVADGPGQSLCLALEDQPFTSGDCVIVPPGVGIPGGAYDNALDPRAFVLALPADVAVVRLTDSGGARREIATIAGEGYAGAYAGRVRFAAARIAGPGDLARIDLLDAAGRILHTQDSGSSGPEVRTLKARRVAGQVGRASLWQSGFRYGETTSRCLMLTDGPAPLNIGCTESRAGQVAVLLRASCATRRLTVAVTAPVGSRIVAVTGEGRSRVMAMRRGAALLTLSPGSGLRSLRVVPRSRRERVYRLMLRAPAGARQCGWEATLDRD